MADIVTGVVTRLAAAGTGGAIVHVFRRYESLFRNWRNKDIEEIARRINGRWSATEVFNVSKKEKGDGFIFQTREKSPVAFCVFLTVLAGV